MIALVVDSTAYLTKAEAIALGIKLIPMSYTIAGQTYPESYSDYNGGFEAMIARNPNCKTSQAPIATYTSAFRDLISQGYEVLCMVISSRLSGTYSSAAIAANSVNPEKIRIVDTRSTAGGMNLLVKKAAELIHSGAALDEVFEKLLRLRGLVGITFSVNNMDALRRSGRVGVIRQSVGTILNIRPILLCADGAVVADGMARGQHEQIRELVGRVPENASKIIVQSISNTAQMEPLRQALEEKLPRTGIYYGLTGPVLAINIGLGAIGVSWICEEPIT